MKQRFVKRIIVAVLFTMAVPLYVRPANYLTINGVQYMTAANGTAVASLTVKAIGNVEIKGKISIKGRDFVVTRVEKAFFKKNEYLSGVSIPNSITFIASRAFRDCLNLTDLVIPDTPCEIENDAFEGCTAISSIRSQTRGNNVDYLLASIDSNCPYFTIEPEPDPIPYPIGPDPGPDPDPDPDPDPVSFDEDIDVDIDIPSVPSRNNRKTFAVIIANENYKKIHSVPMAANDGSVFAQYCKEVLGLPDENVREYKNLTSAEMGDALDDIKTIADVHKGQINVIFYYSGHGMPDEKSRDAYLVPIDANGINTRPCLALKDLYRQLELLKAQHVYVFLDACFSGAGRNDEMLNKDNRGTVIVPNTDKAEENMVIFSATTGQQTAFPYKDRKHGMFTYFLLKKLYRTKGNVTLGELTSYVKENVRERSTVINRKEQSPTVISGNLLGDRWKNMKLK